MNRTVEKHPTDAITVDESTGKVFLSVGSLEQSNWSLENRRFSFGKILTCSI
jgi:hypothetical protein